MEDKRNFVNQVPAGSFKKAFGEHEINYKLMKQEEEAKIAKKREEEKLIQKNHLGSLKFKPKKAVNGLFPGDVPSHAPGQVSQSVDGAPVAEQGGIISNRYLQEIE